jgi:hypothetical protein
MPRNKLTKTLQSGGGVSRYLDPHKNKGYTPETIAQEMLENREKEGDDGAAIMAKANARHTLMAEAGFDYVDCRTLKFSPMQTYNVDEGSIEALADLIHESHNTTPLVVRAIPDTEGPVPEVDSEGNQVLDEDGNPRMIQGTIKGGLEIVDGERRCRAHLLLGERYGETWYMVPVRRYEVGQLSDEDARFILHAENVGQRVMTPSERATGFAAVYDRILALRKTNAPSYAGRATKEILAEQFGVSPRAALMEVGIGKNLVGEGKAMLDEGELTKAGAASVATLPEHDQQNVIAEVKNGTIDKNDVPKAVKAVKQNKPIAASEEHDSDYYLRKSLNAARRAAEAETHVDRRLIADIRNVLDRLDPDR